MNYGKIREIIALILALTITLGPYSRFSFLYANPAANATGQGVRNAPERLAVAPANSGAAPWNLNLPHLLHGAVPETSGMVDPNLGTKEEDMPLPGVEEIAAKILLDSEGQLSAGQSSDHTHASDSPASVGAPVETVGLSETPAPEKTLERQGGGSPILQQAGDLKNILSTTRNLGTFDASSAEAHAAPYRGDKLYDNYDTSAAEESLPLFSRRQGLFHRLAKSALGRIMPKRLAEHWGLREPPNPTTVKIITEYDRDEYGGPGYQKMTLLERIRDGIRRGFNLLGIFALFQWFIKPLLAMLPWPLWSPESLLNATGRVELLISLGVHGIAQAMQNNPIKFLFWDLPASIAYEELAFRILNFGLLFITFAALGPIANALSKLLEQTHELYGFRDSARKILGWLGLVSKKAFWFAAGISTYQFIVAHFSAWGIDPYFMLIHGTLGLALVHMAYKSRSLIVPFIAHYTYNLISIALGVLAPQYLDGNILERTQEIFNGVLVAILFYNWLAYRKDKALAKAEALEKATNPEPSSVAEQPTPKKPYVLLEILALLAPFAAYALYINLLSGLLVEYSFPIIIAGSAVTLWGAFSATALIITLWQKLRTYLQHRVNARAALPRSRAPSLFYRLGAISALLSLWMLIPHTFQNPQAQPTIPTPMHLGEHFVRPDQGQPPQPAPPQKTAGEIFKQLSPSLVTIIVRTPGNSGGMGSGFIVDKEGLVATNAHVVERAGIHGQVWVRLYNGKILQNVKVLALNTHDDLALLQLPKAMPNGWPAVTLGDTRQLQVGDPVFAMGHPFGLELSMTQGIVSGMGNRRGVNPMPEDLIGFVQTDASINSGNSGGVLLNRLGHVVGIPTKKLQEGEGLGMARTIEYLKKRMQQFRQFGNMNSAWLGAIFNFNTTHPSHGIRVEHIRPGSPAEKFGLKAGDILRAVNGQEFPAHPRQAIQELTHRLHASHPGNQFVFAVKRDYQNIQVIVTLGDETKRSH